MTRNSVNPSAVPGAENTDVRNEAFWTELCGSSLARSLGIEDRDMRSLARFDAAYMTMYPYLQDYVDRFALAGRRVLEIGLGYGTLGAILRARDADYFGVDISRAPVEMMRHRLRLVGAPADEHIVQASAAALPFADQAFDFVYSIGCLHHTGQLARSIDEVHRVLVPGGTAVIMLYHADSARQIVRVRLAGRMRRLLGRKPESSADVARMYDANSTGQAAPHTEFVSRRDVLRLFKRFTDLEIRARNLDELRIRGHRLVGRASLLNSPLERSFGLDLYIVARRPSPA